jgi:cyclopropane-fatty-acyl-phospholipid synthase
MTERYEEFVARVRANTHSTDVAWAIRGPDGRVTRLGSGEPVFEVSILNDTGLAAVQSFSELAVAEAYMRGNIDFEGDFFKVMELRHLLKDRSWILTTWAHLSPLLIGRKRLNPKWIAKHYDSKNVQVLGLDREYALYTPGIYDGDDDTLEAGADRKLQNAFSSLALEAGDSLLDVGSGWGGMLRYCAKRGVDVTGLTLSRHQLEFSRDRLKQDGLEGTVLYQDFFTFAPGRHYDAINMMGVMEELSDYDLVMARLRTLLKPDGRIYCDFASSNRRYGIASLVTRYIWPGKFRMVYMPQFTHAVAAHGFEILELDNDRHNYHLWTRAVHERWVARRPEILDVVDEATWRLNRLLQAGVAHSMGPTTSDDTAYRLVLSPRVLSPRVPG